ncbi:MAG: sugar phosphate isomerase/epimerase [Clostridia bacterium]
MKYGQNFRFGFFNENPNERMKAIKQAGFDGVMLWWGNHFVGTDGSKTELAKLAKDVGLKITALHSPTDRANYLWEEKPKADEAVKHYIDIIHACEKVQSPTMVIHTTRKTRPPMFCESGLDAFQKVLTEAEECGINVAVENTRFLEYNDFIYANLKSERLKCCFDSGHNNCYTPKADALAKYGDKVVLTHLHDNIGAGERRCDLHYLMGEGNVDWTKRREQLLKLGLNEINLESYYNEKCSFGKLTMEQYLNLSFSRVSNLFEKGIKP